MRYLAMLLFHTVVDFFMPAIFALIFGGIWSKRGTGQTGIQDKIGLLFMLSVTQAFIGAASMVMTFPVEKNVIQKERASGFYALSAYYFSKVRDYTL